MRVGPGVSLRRAPFGGWVRHLARRMGQTSGMPMPYAPATAAPAATRPRMVRPSGERWIAGVCAGLAEHLHLPVVWVRIGMAALGFSGPGLVAYVLLWALTPQEDTRVQTVDPAAASGVADPALSPASRPMRRGAVLFGLGLMALGMMTGITRAAGPRLSLIVPLAAIGAIAVLGLTSADAAQRDRWLGRRSGWPALARLGAGALAVVVGAIVVLSRGQSVGAASDIAVATIVVLAGMLLLLAPLGLRLLSDSAEARSAQIRADERADIAAHLHDSVLQTLALIQRQSGDPARVATLARVQERELRAYLYGADGDPETSLSGAIARVVDEIEVAHGIPIDVVVTGDREVDDHVLALVRALREALNNAARHGAPPIAVYVEAGPGEVEAFVRDHGPGLDLDAIEEDRLGVRESIIGRMTRAGGTATLRRLDPGTEWTLTLPTPETGGPR